MIGIDTNVLVRYYVNDDAAQHRKAKQFIDGHDVFINNLVLLETFWVLTRVYKLNSSKLEQVANHLKRLSNVRFENETLFARAFRHYIEDNADFADAMIALLNISHGVRTATFDKSASTRLGFERIS